MAKTIKEMAHDHVVAYMHNDEYEEMQDTFEAGANAVLNEVKEELLRAYMNDFEGFSEHDRDIAQGVLGTIQMFVDQLKRE